MAKVRAWWWHRQGLDGSLRQASPAEVLERSGWARSVGGANPYLSLFARAGTGRDDADRAVTRLEIHELPSARGCTYVLPRTHCALGLQVGKGAAEDELRVWQYDYDAGEVVRWLLGGGKPDRDLREVIEATQAFIRSDLGDARSFSLDSPKARGPRVAALRGSAI